MRTKNTYYTNKHDFADFVTEHHFADEKTLLVQLFSSELNKVKIQETIDAILEVLPQAKLIGATTDGEILENVVSTDKMVVSVSAFEKATVNVAMAEHSGDSFACGAALAEKIVQEDTKTLILFSDGLSSNGETFLNGVKTISGDIPLAGGMAGDGAAFETTYVFCNGGILSSGAVGVAINAQKLQVQTAYSFNWQEIGKELIVTKAKENRVYEINGKTAVAIYAQYLGEDIADSLPAIGIEFPLIITRDGVKIARAVLGKEADGSLVFAGNIAEGDTVHFGYGHSGMILKESAYTKDAFAATAVESVFIYSCMARRRFLEESVSTELTPFANMAPTSGFFTYGEFYKKDNCELLNQTMTVISLSEQDEMQAYTFVDKQKNAKIFDASRTQKALSHLIEATSKELTQANRDLEKIVQEKTSALRDKILELENASRVKSEFLAGMSHEIRTPLNAMLGFVDILKAGETIKERQQQFNIIKDSGLSLLTIINDVLDFSKIESGKMLLEKRKFAIKKPFKAVGHLFYEKAVENGIELHVEFSPDLPRFFVGDVVRIKQVASNFLSNALKFTPKGGKVIMRVAYDTTQELLRFSVKDTGVGIDEKNLEKIFEAFTQEDASTTRKFGGTGLGLSISSALINSMNGKIEVKSVLGEGSEFSFTLPLIEAEDFDVLDENGHKKIDLKQKLSGKILVVEDNKTNQMLIEIILEDLGLDVYMAENGLVAVEMFEKEQYDLILMDENMPKMNGIEATKKILQIEKEKALKHTPIIALTANALATDRARFLKAGMDEFIAKPIDNELLIRALHAFLLHE